MENSNATEAKRQKQMLNPFVHNLELKTPMDKALVNNGPDVWNFFSICENAIH